MRVTISNFVCYGPGPTVFEFRPGKMTLIRGDNGTGKTTALRAISWCLYESMRSIYGDGISKRCYVQIEMPGITIYRQTESKRLLLTLLDAQGNPVQYEDQVAQEIINNYYGTRDVWMAASYLQQKSRCLLLTASSSEKLNLLNKLAFNGEDPRQYIEKISNVGKRYGERYRNDLAVYNADIARYQKTIEERTPIPKYNYNDEQFKQLSNNVTTLDEIVEQLSRQQVSQAAVIGTWNTLVARRTELAERLEKYAQFTPELQQLYLEEYQSAERYHQIKEQCQQLLTQIRDESGNVEITPEQVATELATITVTQEDYRAALEQETKRANEISRLDSINLPYDRAAINHRFEQNQDIIAKADDLEERDRLTEEYRRNLVGWTEREKMFFLTLDREHQAKLRQLEADFQKQMGLYQERKNNYLLQVQATERAHAQQVRDNQSNYQRELQQYNSRKFEHQQLGQRLTSAYHQRKLEAETVHRRSIEIYQNQLKTHQDRQAKRQADYQAKLTKLQQNYRNQIDEYNQIGTKLQSFTGQALYDEQQVTQQSLLIIRLESCRDIMSCPHCAKGVRMNNGQLQASDDPLPNLERDIEAAKQLLIEIKNGDYRLKQIRQLEAQLEAKKVVPWDDYLAERLGAPPEPEEFTLPQPEEFSFDEAPPQLTEFTEEAPVLVEVPPMEPLPAFEDPPVKEPAPVFRIEDHTFNEEAPTLELPERLTLLSSDVTKLSLSTARREMAILETIQFLEPPSPSPAKITSLTERRNKLRKIERFFTLLTEQQAKLELLIKPTSNLQILKQQLDECTRQVSRNTEWKNDQIAVEARLEKIVIDQTLNQKLADRKQELAAERVRLHEAEYTRKMNTECERLDAQRLAVIELHQQITDLERLKQEALNLETTFLESTVDTINMTMNDILQNIFDEPIKVYITLFKTAKSTKRTKICFNLRIEHRGAVKESLSEMSGGQGDKISLAMNLALNQLNKTPVLMLDESLAYIDKNTRDACLDMIRQNVDSSKAIIGTANTAIEGYFDDYIDLDDSTVGQIV